MYSELAVLSLFHLTEERMEALSRWVIHLLSHSS